MPNTIESELRKNKEIGYKIWELKCEWMGNQTRSYCLYILCSIVVCGWMRKIIKVTHPTITGSQPLLFFYGWSHATLVHCRARQSTARSKCWDNGAVKGSSNPGWASCLFISDLSFFIPDSTEKIHMEGQSINYFFFFFITWENEWKLLANL